MNHAENIELIEKWGLILYCRIILADSEDPTRAYWCEQAVEALGLDDAMAAMKLSVRIADERTSRLVDQLEAEEEARADRRVGNDDDGQLNDYEED